MARGCGAGRGWLVGAQGARRGGLGYSPVVWNRMVRIAKQCPMGDLSDD
jgi:hypothetical protein